MLREIPGLSADLRNKIMTSIVKRWFVSLVVLTAAAAVISYLVIVLGLGSAGRSGRLGNWLLLAVILATSIGITHVIWNRLNRSLATVKEQLQAIGSDTQAGQAKEEESFKSSFIEPELRRSITATRDRFETLRQEREEVDRQKLLVESRRQQLETILYSIPEAVIVTDSSETVVLANSAAEEMFGESKWEAGAKRIDECIQDEDFLRLLSEAKKSSEHKVAEYSKGSKDSKRWYNVILSPISSGKKGEDNGLLAILHDVTKEKEISRMKTDFVSNVSHELRTPLASIKAYLEMLADGEVRGKETRQKFYEVIQKEADRLSSLVDNILSISRIEAGAVKARRQSIPLAIMIKEVLKVMGPQAEACGIELQEELTPTLVQVDIDKEMMHQAVFNLVSNALKYTPAGGKVTVRLVVEEAKREVRIEVSDTGVGISKEDLPRIFEKFYRVPSSRTMAKGAGMGLALVKEIIETVHNGRVSITSSPGEGSTFALILPLPKYAQELAAV